jgi:hypothetical protein
MRFLQSRLFAWSGALGGGIASLLIWPLPAKMAAEPDFRNFIPYALIAGLTWLVLSLIRHFLLRADREIR